MGTKAEEVEAAVKRVAQAFSEVPEKYHKYITLLPQNKKCGTRDKPEWAQIETPYIAVDGRVRMAVDEHRELSVGFEVSSEFHECPSTGYLLCVATINSGIYGVVKGTARAFVDSKSGADATNPHEVAETSSIGRALGFMGYGLLGGGIASVEEVVNAKAERTEERPAKGEQARPERQVETPQREAPKGQANYSAPTEKQLAFLGSLRDELRNRTDYVERAVESREDAKQAIDELIKLKENPDPGVEADNIRRKFWADISNSFDWSGRTKDDLRDFMLKEWNIESTADLTARQRAICIEKMGEPLVPEMSEAEVASAMADVKSVLDDDGPEEPDDIPEIGEGSWGQVKAMAIGAGLEWEELEAYIVDEYKGDHKADNAWALPAPIAKRFSKMLSNPESVKGLVNRVDMYVEGQLK